MSKAIFFLGFW